MVNLSHNQGNSCIQLSQPKTESHLSTLTPPKKDFPISRSNQNTEYVFPKNSPKKLATVCPPYSITSNNFSCLDSILICVRTLSRVEWEERVLEFIQPLEIIMEKDPENQKMFVFEEESLGIDVFSPTFDGLENEIKECLFFLWDTYAKEDDRNLSGDAVELKRNLLKRVREGPK